MADFNEKGKYGLNRNSFFDIFWLVKEEKNWGTSCCFCTANGSLSERRPRTLADNVLRSRNMKR